MRYHFCDLFSLNIFCGIKGYSTLSHYNREYASMPTVSSKNSESVKNKRISSPVFSPSPQENVIADVLSIPNRCFLVQKFNLFVLFGAIVSSYGAVEEMKKLAAKHFAATINEIDEKFPFNPHEGFPGTFCSDLLIHSTCKLCKFRRRSELSLHNSPNRRASRTW